MLRDGIREGRRTLVNVNKYVLMATSSNFGNMVSMAAAALFLPFLPMRPLQILLNNFLYDVSELPIPTDRVAEADLLAPRRWDTAFIRNFMLTFGPLSSIFDLLAFAFSTRAGHAGGAVPDGLVRPVDGHPGADHLRHPDRRAAWNDRLRRCSP